MQSFNKSLIIPCKEEGENFLTILKRFEENIKDDTEVIVILDSEEDSTYQFIQKSKTKAMRGGGGAMKPKTAAMRGGGKAMMPKKKMGGGSMMNVSPRKAMGMMGGGNMVKKKAKGGNMVKKKAMGGKMMKKKAGGSMKRNKRG